MKPNQICGVLKFFREEERLDQLIAGRLFCNTPEFYRRHEAQGVADPHESVGFAYRSDRGDPEPELRVGGRLIDGLTSLTVRFGGLKDRWLHCWTLLRFPPDEKGFRQMVQDFQRIRSEFGPHYGFILPERFEPFLKRLVATAGSPVNYAEVTYSNDLNNWSPICKSDGYRYQREVRILLGECPEDSLEPRVVDDPQGFSSFIEKNPEVRMVNQKTGETIFVMHGSKPLTFKEL